MLQAVCLLAITKTYANLPTVTVIKAVYFILMYCLVDGLFHLSISPEYSLWISASVVDFLYYLLLGTCTLHMVFQDFSRTRTRKSLDEYSKIDQEVMKFAYRSRRVLKDFQHDLRQPLSTLGILASVGKAISQDSEVAARYQHIQTAQKALKAMLEDFFDQLAQVTRYPQKPNSMPLQAVSIDEVLAPLVEEYRMLAEVKELQIRYVPSELKVFTNKEALSKIARNGLDNAVKYTNKGGVVVGLRRRKGQFCIQIIDTGTGVDSNKVASQNKGWGHGANIIRSLSGQISARTECRNRYCKGTVVGSVFEILLPQESEIMHKQKYGKLAPPNIFSAQVMASNNQQLLEIQKCLPVDGFDKVEFSVNGAYKAYLTALKRGMAPVYIMYVGDPTEKRKGLEELRLLNSLLDFDPCCILIYNASLEINPQVEFDKEIIRVPLVPRQAYQNLSVISELFPRREPNSQRTTGPAPCCENPKECNSTPVSVG